MAEKGINKMMFSTKDQDNDISGVEECAVIYRASWWYSNCHCANPNGEYLVQSNRGVKEGYKVSNYVWFTLKSTQLMMRKLA